MESQIREALQYTDLSSNEDSLIMSFKNEYWHTINQKTLANIVSCNLCEKAIWDCECLGEVSLNKNLISWDQKKGREGRCYCRKNPHGCNSPGCAQVYLRTWTGQPLLNHPVCSIAFPPRSHDDIIFIFKQRIEKVTMSGWLSHRTPYIESLEKQVQALQYEVSTINEYHKSYLKEIKQQQEQIYRLSNEVSTLKTALADALDALAQK